MLRSRTTVLALGFFVAFTAFGALAQNGAGAMLQTMIDQYRKNFIVADKDKDGFLTREEAQDSHLPLVAKNFDRIDTNHTGKVSEAQIEDFLRAGAKAQSQP